MSWQKIGLFASLFFSHPRLLTLPTHLGREGGIVLAESGHKARTTSWLPTLKQTIKTWTFRSFFFLLGGGEGGARRDREGGGGSVFFFENPKKGGSPRRGEEGRGPGGCPEGIWGGGGGGKIFFFPGPKCLPRLKLTNALFLQNRGFYEFIFSWWAEFL